MEDISKSKNRNYKINKKISYLDELRFIHHGKLTLQSKNTSFSFFSKRDFNRFSALFVVTARRASRFAG